MTWHSGKLKTINTSPTQPRQEQKELLKVVNGEGPKRKKEWFWNREREATAAQLLVDFLGCTQCDRAEERMTAWQALQRSVATWDERFADDNDVA